MNSYLRPVSTITIYRSTSTISICRFLSTKNAFRNRATEQLDQLSESSVNKKSTVDPATVEHHSSLCNRWWNPKAEMRLLHDMNHLRVQFVRDGLANTRTVADIPYLPLEGIKIADVGCAGGIFSEALARIGAEVTGIDASAELISVAKQHASLDPDLTGKLNYVQSSIEDFVSANRNTYDAVVASEVIEHVNEQEFFLKCCIDTLKPGGSIFLTTPNRTLPSWLGMIIAAEHIFKLIAKGSHDWNKFITPAEMQCFFEKYGCKTKLIHGLCYNPIKLEWFWTNTRAMVYAIHAVKRKEE